MFEFGIRRIMRMNYTRYVSFPRAWVDSQIEHRDRIKITMDDENRLILEPVKDRMPAAGSVPASSAPATAATPTHRSGADGS